MNIVPRHKFDQEAIANLRQAGREEILGAQRELLTWLQDTCWPVYPHVREVLALYINDMEEAIVEVLRHENDLTWKENVVGHLLWYSADPLSERLKQELKRLIDESREDYEQDLAEDCKHILEQWENIR